MHLFSYKNRENCSSFLYSKSISITIKVQLGKPGVTKLSGLRILSMPASCPTIKGGKMMKTKWVTKGLTGLFAITLVFGTASFANAKGPSKAKTIAKHQVHQVVSKKTVKQNGKTGTVKATSKKGTKKKGITSKVGKTIEKRLNSSQSSINNVTLSINSFFKVNTDGTAGIDLSKLAASTKYNSFKGKLNAEINKLRAIDKQILGYEKKYISAASDLSTLAAKSKELQQLAASEIQRVKTLADQASAPIPVETTPPTTDPSTGSTDNTSTGTTDTSTSGATDNTSTGTTDTSTSGSTDNTTTGTTDPTTSGSTDTTTTGTTDTSTSGSTDTTSTGTTDTTTSGATDTTTTTGTTDTTTSGATTIVSPTN
jgi:hypothetical protein